jgi:hypothetical protein
VRDAKKTALSAVLSVNLGIKIISKIRANYYPTQITKTDAAISDGMVMDATKRATALLEREIAAWIPTVARPKAKRS